MPKYSKINKVHLPNGFCAVSCDLVEFGKDSSATIDAAPQETRRNTRRAALDDSQHRELPELRQISVTDFQRSLASRCPACWRRTLLQEIYQKLLKSYYFYHLKSWSLEFTSSHQIWLQHISWPRVLTQLGIKIQMTFYQHCCHIQIFQKHWGQITDNSDKITSYTSPPLQSCSSYMFLPSAWTVKTNINVQGNICSVFWLVDFCFWYWSGSDTLPHG